LTRGEKEEIEGQQLQKTGDGGQLRWNSAMEVAAAKGNVVQTRELVEVWGDSPGDASLGEITVRVNQNRFRE